MAKDSKRFQVIFKEGTSLNEDGRRIILLDTETGIQYLAWSSGYGAGITPLLDAAGKPVRSQVEP